MTSVSDIEFGLMMAATFEQPENTYPDAFKESPTSTHPPAGGSAVRYRRHIYETFGVLNHLATLTDEIESRTDDSISSAIHPSDDRITDY